MNNRRRLVMVLGACAVAPPLASLAQQKPPNAARIGFLEAAPPSSIAARVEAFEQGLHELGYVEGKNIVIEYRYANGVFDRLPALAAELVRLKVDVIVTGGPTSIRPASEATKTIPIVMAFDTDPVANGFAASLARPGGNITGLSATSPEISGKQMELLKEMVPTLARVAVLGTSTRPGTAQTLKEVEAAATAFKVQVQYFDVLDPKDLQTAFSAASKGGAGAILVMGGPIFNTQRGQISGLAANSQLPAIYDRGEFVEAGGFISYGVHLADLARRAAAYVDKILKGRPPADLPIEQATKFELVINMKAAKGLGITVPQSILLRADRVIQ